MPTPGNPAVVAKMLSDLESQANTLAESMLLKIGDTDPQKADLLGVQEFLRKLE